MQTPSLPIQVTGAANGANATRAKSGAPDTSGQFSQNLAREMDQHKAAAPAPAAGAAKPQQAAKAPQAPADKAPAAPARLEKASAGAAKKAAPKDDTTTPGQPSITPVVDMLALVASFNQLAGVVPPSQAPGPAATVQAGLGLRQDPTQANFAAQLPVAAALPGGEVGAQALPAAPGSAFNNMMAAADGSKPEADPGSDALPAEPMLRQSATDGAREPRAADAALTPAASGKGAVDPAQFANLRTRESDSTRMPEPQVSAPLAPAVQQASLSLANAANGAAAGERIPARVGTPAWDNQVGQKIIFMAAGQEHSASLTLNPPDMGPMQVVLSVTNDLATVTFSSATPEVRQALQDAMPRLRDMMSESGIALGNATVNDGSAQQQQAQGEPGRSGSAQGRGDGPVHASGSAAEAEARVAARPVRVGELPGLVDTFA